MRRKDLARQEILTMYPSARCRLYLKPRRYVIHIGSVGDMYKANGTRIGHGQTPRKAWRDALERELKDCY